MCCVLSAYVGRVDCEHLTGEFGLEESEVLSKYAPFEKIVLLGDAEGELT